MDRNPGVTFIGVPNPGDRDDAARQEFIAGIRTPISHILDDPAEIWQEYGIVSQPSMVFVDADGNRERHVGRADPNELLAQARALVGA